MNPRFNYAGGFSITVDLIAKLIEAEGARSSKMHSHFLRAVLILEAYSMSCGGRAGETPQALAPRRRLVSAESEAPVEINNQAEQNLFFK
jgi:hypothetical protein